ncbi:PAP2 domain-containing protein [Aulographum hederae CBS 113979]|uniref:PAP2 domain-containing protein n=1 Tax=Aulographum hederae CBS 113979 TaxID=1176131 RepID=A0A6G1HCQ6_9PEZI|nr:PAP2 domain-containing protein [Aulographum hederae CBS 113979]
MRKFTVGNIAVPSKRLVASYIFDWFVIIVIAFVGLGWSYLHPYRRPFSLVDLSISYPHVEDAAIPSWLLCVVSIVIPALVVFLVALIMVPGPTVSLQTPKSLIWRRKMWEWNAGWMGLALSLASAYMITQGMKNLFGKPRPDLLSRCNPDMGNLEAFSVGNYGARFNPQWVLVSADICTQTDIDLLDDGFRSFPSGHASASWSGLLYLTLFLCSKFAIAIPFLPPRSHSLDPTATALEAEQSDVLPTRSTPDGPEPVIPIRNQAAAPPVLGLVFAMVPVFAAIYICSTRYSGFNHHGFDIIFGSLIGIATSWGSFRWYHLPVRNGAGWAWGARSRDRAWVVGVGLQGFVGPEGWGTKKGFGAKKEKVEDKQTGDRGRDLEAGT